MFSSDQAFDLLKAAHGRDRLGHAFLITGRPGTGKETLAARLAHLLNAPPPEPGGDLWGDPVEPVTAEIPTLAEVEGPFVRVLRPGSKSRRIVVKTIREMEKMMHQSAPQGLWKVGIFVDADRMNEAAENAFLKTLEEPPPQTLLLLLSSEPERLLPTIWSRCVHLPLFRTDHQQPPEAAELLPLLARATKAGFNSIELALGLKAAFETLLKNRKAELVKQHEAAHRLESKKYQEATEGDWLEERKKIHEAEANAEYLGVRARLVELLLSWLGDLLRQKGQGSDGVPPSPKNPAQTGEAERSRGAPAASNSGGDLPPPADASPGSAEPQLGTNPSPPADQSPEASAKEEAPSPKIQNSQLSIQNSLAFPAQAQLTAKAAQKLSLNDILHRLAALEDLRNILETNVTEALALEVGFMNAFGPRP